MSGSPPLLQAQGIRKRFGSHEVLQGLDLQACQGDVVVVEGDPEDNWQFGTNKSTQE
jgi:ABC-type histidine transport system ATPase subunit